MNTARKERKGGWLNMYKENVSCYPKILDEQETKPEPSPQAPLVALSL